MKIQKNQIKKEQQFQKRMTMSQINNIKIDMNLLLSFFLIKQNYNR